MDYRTSLTPGQREALCPLRSQVHEQSFTSLIAESGVLQFCWRQSCDVDGQASLTLVLVRSNACRRGRGSRERATPWIKASLMFREAVRAASAYVRAQKRESGIPRGKKLSVSVALWGRWKGRSRRGGRFECNLAHECRKLPGKSGSRETGRRRLSGRLSLPIWQQQLGGWSAGHFLRPARFRKRDPVL